MAVYVYLKNISEKGVLEDTALISVLTTVFLDLKFFYVKIYKASGM